MFGPASLLLSRKCCLVCCFCMFLPEIRKARDNKREAGPDMSSASYSLINVNIFLFFVLCFLNGVAMAFLLSLFCFVLCGFPNGFATFVSIVHIVYIVYIVYVLYRM